MIVKLRQDMAWRAYRKRSRLIKALRMADDFMYETSQGWVKGHHGQWLVELGEGLRCNLDNDAFTRQYEPVPDGEEIIDEP